MRKSQDYECSSIHFYYFQHFTDSKFGYCISGQTLRDALHLVLDKTSHFKSKYRYVLVNVGAIDILLEEELIDIEVMYARLVKAIDFVGCKPIITTLPDILVSPNNPNQKIIRQMLLLFNRFLVETFGDSFPVIDLYSSLPKFDSFGTNHNIHYHL